MNQVKNQTQLWSIDDLLFNFPSVFPTEGAVRYLVRNRLIPMVRFTPRGRIFFDPNEIMRWIQKNKISEQGGAVNDGK